MLSHNSETLTNRSIIFDLSRGQFWVPWYNGGEGGWFDTVSFTELLGTLDVSTIDLQVGFNIEPDTFDGADTLKLNAINGDGSLADLEEDGENPVSIGGYIISLSENNIYQISLDENYTGDPADTFEFDPVAFHVDTYENNREYYAAIESADGIFSGGDIIGLDHIALSTGDNVYTSDEELIYAINTNDPNFSDDSGWVMSSVKEDQGRIRLLTDGSERWIQYKDVEAGDFTNQAQFYIGSSFEEASYHRVYFSEIGGDPHQDVTTARLIADATDTATVGTVDSDTDAGVPMFGTVGLRTLLPLDGEGISDGLTSYADVTPTHIAVLSGDWNGLIWDTDGDGEADAQGNAMADGAIVHVPNGVNVMASGSVSGGAHVFMVRVDGSLTFIAPEGSATSMKVDTIFSVGESSLIAVDADEITDGTVDIAFSPFDLLTPPANWTSGNKAYYTDQKIAVIDPKTGEGFTDGTGVLGRYQWDPGQLSLGLVVGGEADILGKTDKANFARLNPDNSDGGIGAKTLTFNSADVKGWDIGDIIAIGATRDVVDVESRSEDEVALITGMEKDLINCTITFTINTDPESGVTQGLKYNHLRHQNAFDTISDPEPLNNDEGFEQVSAVVTNMSRNVRIYSEVAVDEAGSWPEVRQGKSVTSDGGDTFNILGDGEHFVTQQAHVMFHHTDDVVVKGTALMGIGRTDKSYGVDDFVLPRGFRQEDDNGDYVKTEADELLNQRGRYALHLHHGGITEEDATAEVYNNVVWGSPGWGIAHHNGKANILNNVVFDVHGGAINAEFGTEVGIWSENVVMKIANARGATDATNEEGLSLRNSDFGATGVGYWLESRGIDVIDNISVSAARFGYWFSHGGIDDLDYPVSLAGDITGDPDLDHDGDGFLDQYEVPLQRFIGNESVGSYKGLYFQGPLVDAKTGNADLNNRLTHDVRSIVQDFKAWEYKEYGVYILDASNLYLKDIYTSGSSEGEEFYELRNYLRNFRDDDNDAPLVEYTELFPDDDSDERKAYVFQEDGGIGGYAWQDEEGIDALESSLVIFQKLNVLRHRDTNVYTDGLWKEAFVTSSQIDTAFKNRDMGTINEFLSGLMVNTSTGFDPETGQFSARYKEHNFAGVTLYKRSHDSVFENLYSENAKVTSGSGIQIFQYDGSLAYINANGTESKQKEGGDDTLTDNVLRSKEVYEELAQLRQSNAENTDFSISEYLPTEHEFTRVDTDVDGSIVPNGITETEHLQAIEQLEMNHRFQVYQDLFYHLGAEDADVDKLHSYQFALPYLELAERPFETAAEAAAAGFQNVVLGTKSGNSAYVQQGDMSWLGMMEEAIGNDDFRHRVESFFDRVIAKDAVEKALDGTLTVNLGVDENGDEILWSQDQVLTYYGRIQALIIAEYSALIYHGIDAINDSDPDTYTWLARWSEVKKGNFVDTGEYDTLENFVLNASDEDFYAHISYTDEYEIFDDNLPYYDPWAYLRQIETVDQGSVFAAQTWDGSVNGAEFNDAVRLYGYKKDSLGVTYSSFLADIDGSSLNNFDTPDGNAGQGTVNRVTYSFQRMMNEVEMTGYYYVGETNADYVFMRELFYDRVFHDVVLNEDTGEYDITYAPIETSFAVTFAEDQIDEITAAQSAAIATLASFIDGGEQDDELHAGSSGSLVAGFDGNDKLYDGSGLDVLVGGEGADSFVMSGDTNVDRIDDFETGKDIIDLTALDIGSFDELTVLDPEAGWFSVSWSDSAIFSLRYYNSDNTTDLAADDFIFSKNIISDLYETQDQLWGTDAADVFKMIDDNPERNSNHDDSIRNFQSGRDQIDVSAYGIAGWDHMELTNTKDVGETSNWVQIFIDGEREFILRFDDLSLRAEDVTADDFIFAPTDPDPVNIISDLYETQDQLWGTDAADVFKMIDDNPERNSNHDDSIRNFQSGRDQIDVSAYGIAGWDDMTLTNTKDVGETSNWVQIFIDGEREFILRFDDLSLRAEDVTAEDFIF